MKVPITYEKTRTPKRSIKAPKIYSSGLIGWKSPKPTVDKLVKEKYIVASALLPCDLYENS